jgi:hypothetical protein
LLLWVSAVATAIVATTLTAAAYSNNLDGVFGVLTCHKSSGYGVGGVCYCREFSLLNSRQCALLTSAYGVADSDAEVFVSLYTLTAFCGYSSG